MHNGTPPTIRDVITCLAEQHGCVAERMQMFPGNDHADGSFLWRVTNTSNGNKVIVNAPDHEVATASYIDFIGRRLGFAEGEVRIACADGNSVTVSMPPKSTAANEQGASDNVSPLSLVSTNRSRS